MASAERDHAVTAADLCSSDTDVPDADNLVAEVAGDLADLPTQSTISGRLFGPVGTVIEGLSPAELTATGRFNVLAGTKGVRGLA